MPLLLFGCALSSLSRARVSAHTRAPVRFYILRAGAIRDVRRMGVYTCVCVRVRAPSTHRPGRTRAFLLAFARAYTCVEAERGKGRKKERYPSFSRCSRDGGGAQSFTDPLSPTQALSHSSARTTHAHTYTRADSIFRYNLSRREKQEQTLLSLCSSRRITVEILLVVCFAADLRCTGNEIINDERDNRFGCRLRKEKRALHLVHLLSSFYFQASEFVSSRTVYFDSTHVNISYVRQRHVGRRGALGRDNDNRARYYHRAR